MRLDPAEFIRRFQVHVLPQGIRHFGLFANMSRAAHLAQLRALLEPHSASPAVQAANHNAAIVDAFPCPCCGGRMRLIEVFKRGAQPSPAQRSRHEGSVAHVAQRFAAIDDRSRPSASELVQPSLTPRPVLGDGGGDKAVAPTTKRPALVLNDQR